MPTYVRLKDDRVMIISSDNTTEETMHVYPIEREFD